MIFLYYPLSNQEFSDKGAARWQLRELSGDPTARWSDPPLNLRVGQDRRLVGCYVASS
ncbi:hypothetical protein HPP92_022188 [Vanilla planifolia]|uniref:Uncharacterized protein n=1 Tax=Vanilla planifolia TaxID=51239 RepID=A0A835UF19_VANPL|nr:hypothetical protein HPP92_022188 [Vanilla planifolia]